MKLVRAAAAVATVIGVMSASAALAQQNEIIAIFNSAENDSQFAMLSYRRSFGPSLEEGLSFRLDVSRGEFDVPGSTGEIDTQRLLLGYRVIVGPDANLTFYGGPSWRERSYSPVLPGLVEFDEVGAFLSVEYNADLTNGGEVFGLAEYDSTQDLFYASAFYQADVGNLKIGPTVNYLTEGDYERRAAGLRVTLPVSDVIDLTATGAWAEGNAGGPDINSNYLELQVRARF
jgi:hypothetical protein